MKMYAAIARNIAQMKMRGLIFLNTENPYQTGWCHQ